MNKDKKQEAKKPLTREELLANYHSTLIILKMKSKMGQLVQTHQIKQAKKAIARLLTKKPQTKNK